MIEVNATAGHQWPTSIPVPAESSRPGSRVPSRIFQHPARHLQRENGS